MAYNQLHKLHRILEIQDITLRLKKNGLNQLRIYNEYIRPRFMISLRTYNTYLGINARGQLHDTPGAKQTGPGCGG